MTLDKFDYVLALAEEKNLTKAAKRLYISQPGLTAYINKLEEYLGIRLFDRTTVPVRITEAGTLYIKKMKQIQKEELQLRMDLKDMAAQKRIFKIGIGATRGMQWLPLLLSDFYLMHPEVSVQLYEGGLEDLESRVSVGNVDVIFGAFNTGYAGVRYEFLRDERIYCILPVDCREKLGIAGEQGTLECPALITAEQMKDIVLLVPTPSNGFFQFTSQLLQKYCLEANPVLHMNNLDVAYQLVAQGVGACFINAADFHRVHPELDREILFCTLEQEILCRQAMLGYQENGKNKDLVEDMKEIIYGRLLPELEENRV